MRTLLRIGFNGNNYAGWQIQPDQPTVQHALEKGLGRLYGDVTVPVTGSSRTDAGVSAKGFAAHFDMPDNRFTPKELTYRLNSVLPADIIVNSAVPVADDFHARYSARGKIYRYTLSLPGIDRERGSLVLNELPPLELLRNTGHCFVGTHDFGGFGVLVSMPPDRHCTVRRLDWHRTADNRIVMETEGNRFLHHMVRFMVGAHLEVWQGRMTDNDIRHMLETGSRGNIAIRNPSGSGLCLVHVIY